MHKPLFEVLEPTFFGVCRDFLAAYPLEEVYAVTLFTTSHSGGLWDCIATTNSLAIVAQQYLDGGMCGGDSYREKWRTLDVAMRELKWSLPDSPHYGEFGERFETANDIVKSLWRETAEYDDWDEDWRATSATISLIKETCNDVLIKVRDSGLFAKERVVFSLMMGDESDESRLVSAEKVNSPEVVAWYRKELQIDEDRLAAFRKQRDDA